MKNEPTSLSRLRCAKGITQAALAEKAGVGLRTLQDYEQGKRQLNQAAAITVYRIAEVLGATVEDLLDLERRENV